MRVPDIVRDCVVFIGTQEVDASGQLSIEWGGTGFFVSLEHEPDPTLSFVYLVTAQHVVQAVQSKGFIIRANTKNGEAMNIRVAPNEIEWFFHPTDPNADVAVMPFALPPGQFDYSHVPVTTFLTEDVLRKGELGIGDEVYITGLFRNLTGTKRNLPIVRIGNVAMLPDERVPTEYGLMNAYLIEARSLGGLSGSPVFIHTHVNPQMFLLGLMQGHWHLPATYRADSTDGLIREDFGDKGQMVNMGIAIVVPATDIHTALYQPALSDHRRVVYEDRQRQHLPVADSEFTDTADKERLHEGAV